MQKVLTAEQMRSVDRATAEQFGVASVLLMQNAAHAAVDVLREKLGGSLRGRRVLVVCGTGNNGGDGAAAARLIFLEGGHVDLMVLGKIDNARGDARLHMDAARAMLGRVYEVTTQEAWTRWLSEASNDRDAVIDAVFGTGLNRPVEPWLETIFRDINNFGRPLVMSLDVPSGIGSDSADINPTAISADVTVSFTAPKPANALVPAARKGGELIVRYIGSPKELVDASDSHLYLAGPDDAKRWLADTGFTESSYKNRRGHALIIAGSKNYTGAAVLAGDAAIRSGAGLVTLAVPEGSRESVVARVSPEIMVRSVAETEAGSAAERAYDDIAGFLGNIDVVAVGSGLSAKEADTRRFVARVVDERQTPVVLDADALTALSPFNIKASDGPPLVLTPHEGEFMRLLGTDDKSVISDWVAAVREFASKHGVILVLKGERVLIGTPEGDVVVSPSGNAGLGKAGNGDTLTGIVAGFAAQAVQMKIDMTTSVVAAVYIAGLAGDAAEARYGKRVMTASDVRECLAEVFSRLEGSE